MKALVVLSGGQDSTTCLFWTIDKYGVDQVQAVTFDYGQRHLIEIEAAKKVAEMAGIPRHKHEIIQLGAILKGTSPLVNPDSELEQYADHHSLPGGLEKTFVPMRNQLFLTIAANRAYVLGCQILVTGLCNGDQQGYPDCRPEFIKAFENVCNKGTFTGEPGTLGGLEIEAPLLYLDKADTVRLADDLPGCMEALAYSHTAYDGAYPPTGHDHATLLRAKGFEEAGLPDPLILRAVAEGLMKLPDSSNYQR